MVDDAFEFKEESAAQPAGWSPAWQVLIVDDEPDVHASTIMALRGQRIDDRPLAFLQAYSAAEALQLLRQHPDVAVVLLDVVMESEHAGLELVGQIRHELGNRAIRIILRTGQPGFAPELQTIQHYDINDYKSKAYTRSVDLFTSLATAVRSYHQIRQLEANRNGLELIVKATAELSQPRGLKLLAQGIIRQLCALLGIHHEGLLAAAVAWPGPGARILAAAGRYADWVGQDLQSLPDPHIRQTFEQVFVSNASLIGDVTCLYFPSTHGHAMAAYVRVAHPIDEVLRHLLEVFCGNMAIAFDNAALYEKVSEIAFQDSLTGLPSRHGFLSLIDERPAQADTIALLDFDGFSDVNNALDQAFGDSVLCALAQQLRSNFSQAVVVARVGGDVFGLLGPADEVSVQGIARLSAQPLSVGSASLRISLSSGLVQLEADTPTVANHLFRDASLALKQAKMFNRGKTVTFQPALANAARDRMHMLHRLREALTAERLFVVYQPFIDLVSERVVGAEALLRWRTETGEFVPPDRFIPIAEQSGLMVPIGDWVMKCALRFASRLARQGHQGFRMAINVSNVQFREPDFVDKLLQAIQAHELPAQAVEVELTESVAVDDVTLITEKLSALRAHGVAVAIDDFGTGYSSLNIIRQLPVNRLKIDRAFVSGSAVQGGDFGIAEMVINLSNHLKLETIAEGIETPEQHRKLLALGCKDGQGFLFSRPLPEPEFEAFMQARLGAPRS